MSLKVGELFAVVGLEDELSDDLLRVERRFTSTAESMDADANLGVDDSELMSGTRRAQGRLDDVDRTTATAEIEADTSGFDDAGAEIEDAISGWEAGVMGAAAGLGALAGDKLASSFQDAIADEASTAKLQAQIGVDPETAGQLGWLAGDLYAQNFGESPEQIKEAMRRMWQNGLLEPGMGRAEAERYTGEFLSIISSFGEDEAMLSQALAKMVDNGLVASQAEALDLMAVGLNSNANNADDLAETMQEYSTQFRELGIDGATAMGLMSQGLHGGARDADTVADGLKTLAIEAQSGSEASVAALEAIGIAPEAAAAAFREGGDAASSMTALILQRMRDTRGSVDEAAVGFGLMGTKWEDMQDAVYDLDPSTAKASFGEIEGAASRMSDTLSNNTASSIESLQRSFDTDLSRGWQKLLDDPVKSIGAGSMEWYVGRWESFFQEAPGWAGGAVEQIEGVLGEVPGWLGGFWEQIEDGVGKLPEIVGGAFDPLEEIMAAPFRALVDVWNELDPSIHVQVPDWVPGIGGRSLDIDDLFPDLPTFHTGGDVLAPMPGGEVFAKLLDGERVLNRSEATAYRAGEAAAGGGDWRSTGRPNVTYNVTVNVAGRVTSERDLIQAVSMGLRESARSRR